MTAYYNEIDPKKAASLRELIKQGHIAPGEVDERSIEDVRPDDLEGFTQCHFFAGGGVWSYALRCAGWADDRPVWTASCPCQPFSAAGKGAGFADERHLWPAFFHLLRVRRPRAVFGEQVSSNDGLAWFDHVRPDLEGEGYAVGVSDTCAAGFGAPHIRQRLYFVADTERIRLDGGRIGNHDHAEGGGEGASERGDDRKPVEALRSLSIFASTERGPTNGFWSDARWIPCRDGKWRSIEPGTFPLAHGASARVGRLHIYGDCIVAPQAEAFIEAYMEEMA